MTTEFVTLQALSWALIFTSFGFTYACWMSRQAFYGYVGFGIAMAAFGLSMTNLAATWG